MDRDAQLKFCSVCKNKTFNPKHGTICGLTNELPMFSGTCKDYLEDEREVRLQKLVTEKEESETKKTLNKGRYALIVIGALYILMGFLEGFLMAGNQLLFGIIDWIIAAIFFGLGVWSFYKPYVALISGLIFYLLLILLFAIVDPMNIIKGIVLKIIIISYLIYSIKVAKNEHSAEQSNEILDQI
jgi:hypothetical protein